MVIKKALHSVSSFSVLTNEKTKSENSDGSITTSTSPALNVQPPSPFAGSNLVNACSAADGARVLFATDEWFASADCLLKDGPPLFDADAYCNEGKVMDGWESRRRREEGHDWCFIKLAAGGAGERLCIQAVEVDTAHFTGNNAPAISLELCDLSDDGGSSSSPNQAFEVVKKLPGAMERLVQGFGHQGVGHSPEEVQAAKDALKDVKFQTLLPTTPLSPGYQESRMHYFEVERSTPATHLRVNYFPDGGVARLRLWGTVAPAGTPITKKPLYMPISGKNKRCHVVPHSSNETMPSQLSFPDPELSKGGVGVTCTNQHYGTPQNLLQSNFGKDMGDGWETARHPDRPSILHNDSTTGFVDCDLSDCAVLKLSATASHGISRIILDTKHFRGNYPESVRVDGCFSLLEGEEAFAGDAVEWFPLIDRVRMSPDSEHVFDRKSDEGLVQVENGTCAVTHVKVTIFPDGGISRVRVYGASADESEPNHITSAASQ
eukprot:CAMPEP_0194048904 /NCGR_PEP_ID=MMETSP0009_2-20130614/28963_1 /TAXON_ID=210454 /ORGANISM="Grammatophora oceanica, Strain CCMP 410" /LENGTH=490 /DNA_ID=CAMNT_0038694929 /DNA_START=76 /DNA_END=1548 /DNA_ORIENTATION=+